MLRLLTAAILLVSGYLLFQHLQLPSEPVAAGKPMVQVSVPKLTAIQQQGEQLFNENCASCHGQDAAGQYGVAPPLVHIIYEPNHHGDRAFQLAAQRGVRQHHWQFGNMPAVPSVTFEDITKITSYVRGLQRANSID
ncbi:MAG: c-type cytochrome [Rhizobiaceae bacterium]